MLRKLDQLGGRVPAFPTLLLGWLQQLLFSHVVSGELGSKQALCPLKSLMLQISSG